MSGLTFSFLAGGAELRLPVSPAVFGWGAGQNVRELTVNGAGTVYLPGDPAAHGRALDILLPARRYPFVGAWALPDPYAYIRQFTTWIRAKQIVRYVVPGVVNARVVIEDISYEERDGSGDVYCQLYLRESPALQAVTTQAAAQGGEARDPMEEDGAVRSYTVVSGDCLSVICRRFYGNGTARYYNALAAYNGIQNPHLIFPGQIITLPPAGQLGVQG